MSRSEQTEREVATVAGSTQKWGVVGGGGGYKLGIPHSNRIFVTADENFVSTRVLFIV